MKGIWTAVLALGLMAQGYAQTVSEQYLLQAVNRERAAKGLAAVMVDQALMQAARQHAVLMAEQGAISHQFSGEADLQTRAAAVGARFQRISENVATAPTAVMLHDEWMHSPGHRANILDSAVDAVGIAVVARGRQLYAVEDFARTVQQLTLEQQEASIGMLLDQAGVSLLTDETARKTCSMNSGYAGEQPQYVFRFTTSDLSRLPERLKARLAAGKEHHAAVGACPVDGDNAFTSYRLAVLLYP